MLALPGHTSEQRTLSKTQNNHLTGKAPYKFEAGLLQQRVRCEPDSLDQGGEIASLPDSLPLDWAGAQNNLGNALAALPLSRRRNLRVPLKVASGLRIVFPRPAGG